MIFPLVSIDVNWFFTLMILLLFMLVMDSHSLHSARQEDLCKLDNWFPANHELIINCTRSKVIFFRFEAELKLVTLHKS